MSSNTNTKKRSTMDSFMEIANKVGSQRHLVAIRDGFISLMPIIMTGSLALILILPMWKQTLAEFAIGSFPLGAYFVDLCNGVWWGTFGMLTLYAVFAIAFHLAKHYDPAAGMEAGLIALASYLALTPQGVSVTLESGEVIGTWGNIGWGFTSANSLFVGLLVALVSTEIYVRLRGNKKLIIRLPDTVPPAVSRSFAALFPAMITVFIIVLGVGIILPKLIYGIFFVLSLIIRPLSEYAAGLKDMNIFQVFTELFAPLVRGVDSYLGGLVVVLLNHILWFFGLHGSNIIGGVFEPISLVMIDANSAALAAGTAIPHIVTKPFLDAFVYIGGSGTTLGLLIAMLILCRSKQMRTVGQLSIAPGFFNINEPAIFGIPIVLNITLIIPFILAPVATYTLAYIATSIGLLARTVVMVPWAMPPIISGWLATGGKVSGVIMQIINVALSIVIYIPFVRMADKIEIAKEKESEQKKAARAAAKAARAAEALDA